MKLIQKLILTITFLSGTLAIAGVMAPPANAAFGGSQEAACNGATFGETPGKCKDGNRADLYSNAGAKKVEGTITAIVNLLTIIVGMAAVVMLIINGLKFVTSAGDSNAISSARNGILYAIVGLIIVALAQVIVRFVINKAS